MRMSVRRMFGSAFQFSNLSSVLALSAIAVTAGCSSTSTSLPSGNEKGGTQAPGTEGTDNTPGGNNPQQAADVNPYGVAYPTKEIGINARRGSTPGSIIKNFKFIGFRDGDTAQGRKNISLADFFDPENRQFKLIHLSVAGVWCGPCNDETRDTKNVAPGLRDKKVAFFQALGDGKVIGTGATMADLDFWMQKHTPNFTVVLDPDVQNLGVFFDRAAIPFNMDIDPRSMEILSAGTGYNGNVTSEVEEWLDWVEHNPKYEPK